MIGLETVKNKKLSFFKFDNFTAIKNFIHNPGKVLLVMGGDLKKAFAISLDGSRWKARIKAPTNDYLRGAPHALIKNELSMFGGIYINSRLDKHKVRKLLEPENE